jgi:hypothetical protein
MGKYLSSNFLTNDIGAKKICFTRNAAGAVLNGGKALLTGCCVYGAV